MYIRFLAVSDSQLHAHGTQHAYYTINIIQVKTPEIDEVECNIIGIKYKLVQTYCYPVKYITYMNSRLHMCL